MAEAIWKPRIRMLPPGAPGPSQGMWFQNQRGEYLSICVCVEPFNDDGSFGLHVSIRHKERRAWDSEVRPILKLLFRDRKYEEENGAESLARHFWEVEKKSGAS